MVNSDKNNKSDSPPAKKRNNRRRRPNQKRGPRNNSRGNSNNRGPKVTGFEKVERAYLNLLEKHLESRKKYYSLYHRADPRQLAKLEKSFYRSLEELRQYESNIKPEYVDKFKEKYDGLRPDHTYSTNHEISPEQETVELSEDQIDDPHLLPSQVDHEFKGDSEESMGSIDDYNKYKGL